MALKMEVHCKEHDIFESKELQKIEFTQFSFDSVSTLDVVLLEVHSYFCPNPIEYKHRICLVDTVNEIVKDTFGSVNGYPLVEAFGSFMMDMFSTQSDLDLSINLNSDQSESLLPRVQKINILQRLVKVLRSKNKRMFDNVQPILSARVPIAKFVDCASGIECDVSVENKDGITKSFVIFTMSSIDERFKILSCLMKLWAKTNGINSSRNHSLNSLSIILLVVLHLQTRDPPILPPLSSILKGGTDRTVLQDTVGQFKQFGKSNTETVAQLFIDLLYKLSAVETLWKEGLCASVFEGSWIIKKWEYKIGIMSVEDFLDRSQNCARAVSKGKFKIIYSKIFQTIKHVSLFCKGQTEASKFKALVFIPFTTPIRKKAKKMSKRQKRKLRESGTFDSFNPLKRANKSKVSMDINHVSKTSQSNLTHKEENHGREKASMVSPKWLNNCQDSIASQVQHHGASSSQTGKEKSFQRQRPNSANKTNVSKDSDQVSKTSQIHLTHKKENHGKEKASMMSPKWLNNSQDSIASQVQHHGASSSQTGKEKSFQRQRPKSANKTKVSKDSDQVSKTSQIHLTHKKENHGKEKASMLSPKWLNNSQDSIASQVQHHGASSSQTGKEKSFQRQRPKSANKTKVSKDSDQVSKTSQIHLTHKKENHGKEKASMLSPKWLNSQDSIASQVQHHGASSSQTGKEKSFQRQRPKSANRTKVSKDSDQVSKTSQIHQTHKEENHGKEKASMVSPKWLNNAQYSIASQMQHHASSSQTRKKKNRGREKGNMLPPKWLNNAQDTIALQEQNHHDASSSQIHKRKKFGKDSIATHFTYHDASSSQMTYSNSNQNNPHLHHQHPQQLFFVPPRLDVDRQYHPQHYDHQISRVPYGQSYMPQEYQNQVPYIPPSPRNWYQQPHLHLQPQFQPHDSYRQSYGYGPVDASFWQPHLLNPPYFNYGPY